MIGKKKTNNPEQVQEKSTEQIEEEMKVLAAKPKKKKIPAWAIAPLIGVLVVAGVLGSKKAAGTGGDDKTVDVVKVEKGDVRETYSVNGIVKSDRIEKYYSPVNAPIDKVRTDVGQIVKAGDVLVSFDTKNLELDNQKAELSARQAQLSNQDTIHTSNKAYADAVEAQDQAVQDAVNAYNDLVNKQNDILNQMNAAAAGADAETQENENNAQKNKEAAAYITAIDEVLSYDKDRISELNQLISDGEDAFQNKSYTLNNYTNYNSASQTFSSEKVSITSYADLKVWANNLTIQTNNLTSTKAGQQSIVNDNPVSTALNDQYTALKAQYDELEPQIEQAANAIEKAGGSSLPDGVTASQMENMNISEQLNKLASLSAEELVAKGKEGVKADFDGVVVEMQAVEGTPATQGGELLTVADMKNLTVSIDVPANDFEKVFVGEKAIVKIGKNEYRGTVIKVNQVATSTATASVGMSGSSSGSSGATIGAVVRIDNADANIIVGVTAKLTLTVSEEENVLTLPIEVVNTNTKGDFVYVIENGVVKTKDVKVGGTSDSKIEIVSGLKEGEQVVSDTSGDISEGMKATAAESN